LKFKTKAIFNNRKTKFSVDFGVCPLMYKNNSGNYVSDTCPGCYSARLLNVYPGVRNKLESMALPPIEDFKDDIRKIKQTGHRFIRFYSLGDFGEEAEIPYIHAAADIMPVEIFSKTLHTKFQHLISRVASHPNVHISLSTNKTWDDNYIKSLFEYLREEKVLRNVQLNYTFIGDEPMRKVPYISVYHTTKKDKLPLFKFAGYNRVCCAREEDGTRITAKNTGNTQGSCAKCPLCKLPAADANGTILVPGLLKGIY